MSSLFVSEQLNEELKQNLRETMTQKYEQSSYEHITSAVNKLQQEVRDTMDITTNFTRWRLLTSFSLFNSNIEVTTHIYF